MCKLISTLIAKHFYYYEINFLQRLSLLLIGSFNTLIGQNLSGPDPVCPLNFYYFQIDNIPPNWTVKQIDWLSNSAFLGNNAHWEPQTHNGLANGKLKVKWGTTQAPQNEAEIRVEINYDYPTVDAKGNPITGNATKTMFRKVKLKGIPSAVGFKTPVLNIQKCCTNEIEYELEDVGDADTYLWTNNTGFTVVSGGTGSSKKIKLKPSADTGGKLKCRLSMSCSPSTYYREVEIDLTRYEASVSFLPEGSSGSNFNQTQGICAQRVYTYEIKEVCGATSYTWNFPPSWQTNPNPILKHKFWVSGKGTHKVTIKTANAPLDGDITVTAHFGGCSPVTAEPLPVVVLAGSPGLVDFANIANEYFHCGEWKFCDVAQLFVSMPPSDFIESYTWNIAPPWYFQSANGPVQTLTTNVANGGYPLSPQFVRVGNSSSQLSVYATNCKGNGPTTTIAVVPEDPAWCPGTPFWSPYPIGCECCQPGSGNPMPLKRAEQANSFSLYPNPSTGLFTISLPDGIGIAELVLTDMAGRVVYRQKLTAAISEVKTSALSDGLYQVQVIAAGKTFIEQLIIQGNGD